VTSRLLSRGRNAGFRETASSSGGRVAASRERLLIFNREENRDKHRIAARFYDSMSERGRFGVASPDRTLFLGSPTIARPFRSLSKRCNELSMKNLARVYHRARAGTREKRAIRRAGSRAIELTIPFANASRFLARIAERESLKESISLVESSRIFDLVSAAYQLSSRQRVAETNISSRRALSSGRDCVI